MTHALRAEPEPPLEAAFIERPNRFVVVAELADGTRVRAHLPNTGRLTHLTTPGRRFLLQPSSDPHRLTNFTATRAWDGCWVALEAGRAPALLAQWLARHPLPGYGRVDGLMREVLLERHRIDLLATIADQPVWIEVKSGGRAAATDALLSQTPSTRATAQLAALGRLTGDQAAVVFVVQRPDVSRLRVGGDADPGWIEAVRQAAAAGVAILAYGCEVTPTTVRIDRRLPIVW